MKQVWTLAICLGIACSTIGLDAQGASSQYRAFKLGSDLPSVARLAGMAPADAKVTHQRPAVLQELEWRPSHWVAGSPVPSTDPVEQIAFGFYNDQLFRIVVDYGHARTEGMTSADMIEAISAVYGPAVPQAARAVGRMPTRLENEAGLPVARWGDIEHAVVLYQTSSYSDGFRLILTETRLDDLARKAETQAIRLDDQDAPRLENIRQEKARDDARDAAEKARGANKPAFRP